MHKIATVALLSLLVGGLANGNTDEPSGLKPLPPEGSPGLQKMAETYEDRIKPIFEKKCAVCHSSDHKSTWLYRTTRTTKKALRHLDIAGAFPFRGKGTTQERIGELYRSVDKRNMPPFMRRLTTPSSKITGEERDLIFGWLNQELALTRTGTGKESE